MKKFLVLCLAVAVLVVAAWGAYAVTVSNAHSEDEQINHPNENNNSLLVYASSGGGGGGGGGSDGGGTGNGCDFGLGIFSLAALCLLRRK